MNPNEFATLGNNEASAEAGKTRFGESLLKHRDEINISRKFIFQVSESAATVEHEAKVRSFLLLSLWWDAAVPKIIPKE